MQQRQGIKPYDPSIDYVALLNEDEIKEEDGRKFVYLRGLERLAKERGIANASVVNLQPVSFGSVVGILCTYQYAFWDGAFYHGSADATVKNCEGNFTNFLTAMAESRAKARALRTAFGITLCSVEEKADAGAVVISGESESSPIEDHQATAIKFLGREKGLSESDIVALIGKKVEISKLTRKDARDLIAKLNEHSTKKVAAKERAAPARR